MIPIQYALRRRHMCSGERKEWEITVTDNSADYNCSPSINGVRCGSGKYIVKDGDTIILYIVAFNSEVAHIRVNGTVVQSVQGPPVGPPKRANYKYVVKSNCAIVTHLTIAKKVDTDLTTT